MACHVLRCAQLGLTDFYMASVSGGKPKVADFYDWRVTTIQQSVVQLQIPCSAKLQVRTESSSQADPTHQVVALQLWKEAQTMHIAKDCWSILPVASVMVDGGEVSQTHEWRLGGHCQLTCERFHEHGSTPPPR